MTVVRLKVRDVYKANKYVDVLVSASKEKQNYNK